MNKYCFRYWFLSVVINNYFNNLNKLLIYLIKQLNESN